LTSSQNFFPTSSAEVEFSVGSQAVRTSPAAFTCAEARAETVPNLSRAGDSAVKISGKGSSVTATLLTFGHVSE
jgi:hypothetical protein